jgi:hypothetical protein
MEFSVEQKSKMISAYFERNYLEWQKRNGLAPLTAFADFLGMSKSHLSNLINRHRWDVSQEKANLVAERTGDYTILDILGYANPKAIPASQMPEDLRSRLSAATQEITDAIVGRGLDPDSDEALQLSLAILVKHGFKIKDVVDLD